MLDFLVELFLDLAELLDGEGSKVDCELLALGALCACRE